MYARPAEVVYRTGARRASCVGTIACPGPNRRGPPPPQDSGSALHEAAAAGQAEAVSVLLDAGVTHDLPSPVSLQG